MNKMKLTAFCIFLLIGCNSQTPKSIPTRKLGNDAPAVAVNHTKYDTSYKTIHVLVALCDNKYQGIVPVPPKIGNGQDAENNLYWGCSFGIRSYFKNSKNWKLVKRYAIDSIKMERLIFKHTTAPYYLVADAYNGKYIEQCTIDFLKSCAGQIKDTVLANGKVIGINGNAQLLAYIGHDGLMDFSLKENYTAADDKRREAIMLACISKKYFAAPLSYTKANPLLWSTGLMSPEAYTLHDALESYIQNKTSEYIRMAAAKAYSKYQHCSVKAAMNLLVTGK
jgi:hypothetical protein